MKGISGNSIVIKEVNINLVRKALKEMRQATKQQIAEATGLSTVTVGTILQLLLKQNEAFEVELSLSRGGRPAQQFKYNADYAFVLILYPYETDGIITIHSTVVNLIGERIYEMDVKVENVDLKSLEKIIDELLVSYPAIQAIGFGLPGMEYGGKMVVSDYKELLGVSIIEHFSAWYQKPVIMENDVNAAVIGFSKRKRIDDECTVVYLYFPESYPPGAGIFINGKLYKGKRNFAGEVANIPLGISWVDVHLHTSFDLACEAIAKLTIAISSVLNPDILVLYGDFLSKSHIDNIAQKCGTELPQCAVPEILLSESFDDDYLSGMIIQTLGTLESSIILARN